jgi:hypothetical protein
MFLLFLLIVPHNVIFINILLPLIFILPCCRFYIHLKLIMIILIQSLLFLTPHRFCPVTKLPCFSTHFLAILKLSLGGAFFQVVVMVQSLFDIFRFLSVLLLDPLPDNWIVRPSWVLRALIIWEPVWVHGAILTLIVHYLWSLRFQSGFPSRSSILFLNLGCDIRISSLKQPSEFEFIDDCQ